MHLAVQTKKKKFKILPGFYLVFIFSFWTTLCYPTFADFQKYGVEDGLSSITVFATIEDKDGFVWVATEEGVDRFDGLNFKHYDLPNLFKYRVDNDVIHYIEIDTNNQIWVVTLSGLIYRYNRWIDGFTLFYRLDDKSHFEIQAFYIDNNNQLWFGTLNGTLVFDPESKKIHEIPSIKEKNSAITQDNQNRYYLATDSGIQVLNSSRKVLFDLLDTSSSENTATQELVINSLYFDEVNNRLWFGSSKLGLCAFNLINYDFIKPEGFPKLEGISIKSIEKFNENELILGIDGEGLIIWDIDKKKVSTKITDTDEGLLNSKSVQHVYRNKSGIFFISTWWGGLNVYNPKRSMFQSISHIQNIENSLTNDVVLSLFNIENGVIGFGTDKGISIWDKPKNSWQHLNVFNNKEKHISNSKDITADKHGNIWAITYTDSLVVFKKNEDGKYHGTKDIPLGLRSQDFNMVYAGDNNKIWLSGNVKQRLTLYSIETNEVKHFPLTSGQVQTMIDFLQGRLLVGTSSGLKIFNKEKNVFEVLELIESSKLKSAMISSISIDDNKQVWVGTRYEGLFVVNFYKNTITRLSTSEGLTSNRIFSVVANKDDVWASTAKGISKINSKLEVSHYSRSDGLISVDFNYNTALLNDDQLYFGTNKGVITFNPNIVHSIVSKKNLVFNEFYLNHKRVLAGKNSPLDVPLNESDMIRLDHNQNSFSIAFSSIDFLHPDQGDFIWKLENFDVQWIKNQKNSRASYTNLNPGEYIFTLRMVNQKAEMVAPERQLKILIAPPFWLTNWAYFLYFIVGTLLFAFLVYMNTLRVTSKNSKEKLNYLVNIAHEIKTPLMLIKAPLTDLLNNTKMDSVISQGIQIALKNSEKVNRQMVQFLDFRHFSLRKKTVINNSIDVIRLLKDKVFAFKVLADEKDIELSFKYEISELTINIDNKILGKIIDNLLSNAIKYTNKDGKIVVELIVDESKCKIRIADSGIGVPKSQRKKIFQLFYRTQGAKESESQGNGVGLVLARNLAKSIHGKIRLEESSPRGSIFSLIFPFEILKAENKNASENLYSPISSKEKNESRQKVLLIEDDQDLLEFSKRKLSEKYCVITASDGIPALDIIKKNQPDIIVSDIIMPKMSGIQFCMRLKKNIETCHIPIILLSGLSSKENVIQGLESGADNYITKPYDYELLISKMEGLLRNRSVLKKKFLFDDYSTSSIVFSNKIDDNFMSDLTQFVEDNISDEDLSVKDLCDVMGMSRTSFYHKIKGLIDISPNEFIRTVRLKKGKAMLSTCNYNVSEVAYNVGFSDAKYFGTLFKKYYGKSPSVFLSETKYQSKQITE